VASDLDRLAAGVLLKRAELAPEFQNLAMVTAVVRYFDHFSDSVYNTGNVALRAFARVPLTPVIQERSFLTVYPPD
jgi:hypothetical protein